MIFFKNINLRKINYGLILISMCLIIPISFKLLSNKKADSENILEIVSNLISFKTVYPNNPEEFTKCANYIKNHFKDTNLHIEEFEFNGSPSLVISNHKTKNFDIIFCGHIDVVPAPDNLFKIKEDNGILYGRGVSDMKGQVAVMMQIMKDLSQQKIEKKIALFLTSDEERGGFNGTNKLLNEENYSCKVAIVPDGGFNYNLVIEEKGVLQIKITAKGKSSHASEPWNGNNAITKLFDLYAHINSNFPSPKNQNDWKTSFNVGKIEGGDSINKVPNEASMYIDIRHIHSDKMENITNFIKNFDESLNIEILAIGKSFKTNENNTYIKQYIDVCESLLNRKIDIIKLHCASDGRFFTEKNIPCIMMNPEGGNIHCDDEWINLKSLSKLKEIYESYIENFIG